MTKILIVDDSPTNREIIREALYAQHYEFDEATDGCDAFEKAIGNPPDLILMDVTMPRMDGVKALASLKADRRTASIPIVMVSASSAEDCMAKCFDGGACDYIVPPFSEIVFRARVKAALRSGIDDPVVTSAHKKNSRHKPRRGKILGVLGAKGGVGTTTVAIGFACELLGRGECAVGLLELACMTNSLAAQLGIAATVSFGSLVKVKANCISTEAFAKACVNHPAGFKVMFAPCEECVARELRPSLVKRLVATASRHWSYAVLDISTTPTAATRSAVAMCDQLVLVAEPDRASIVAAKHWLHRLSSWEVRRGDISIVVVHKSHDQQALSSEELRNELGFPIIANIKPDPDAERLNARLAVLSGKVKRTSVVNVRSPR